MLSFRHLLPSSRALTRLPAGAPQRVGFRWKSTTTSTGSQGLGAVLRPTAIDFAVHIHMTDAGSVSTTETQKTLKQTLRENEELRADVEQLMKKAQRMNAQMTALVETNEKLVKERDSYKEHPDEDKEKYVTQLREVTEEMTTAARFTEKEWREHCDQVETEGRRLRRAVDVCMPASVELLSGAEEAARRRLQDEEEEQRRELQGPQWEASLDEVAALEAARAEAVFAARGLSMKKLRRTHLGKGPATGYDSYAAGEGLYNLFLALRPGGPVDRFAMWVLLKGETNVTELWYNTQGQEDTWGSKHFTIPDADAHELAACVLCHLPELLVLAFHHLPPLSTCSLEWVSNLPLCFWKLILLYTHYTVTDLRKLRLQRGGRWIHVFISTNYCTDWEEFASVSDVKTKKARVNKELRGMSLEWY